MLPVSAEERHAIYVDQTLTQRRDVLAEAYFDVDSLVKIVR